MNIPAENRPVAFIKVNIKHHPKSVKEIAAWLHKQADYLVKHQTELSTQFTARLFIDPPTNVHRPVLTPRIGYRIGEM